MASPQERREALKELLEQVRACTRCPELAAARHQVVFGAGHADADLMFVGEAPGANEDKAGLPFVGQAGQLLEKLLMEIGLERSEVFITNVLKSRPPNNRDPQAQEIANCRDYLLRQIELIEPRVICTLGNFATKLLRDDPTGITRVHGRPEVRVFGTRAVNVYPIFHPAAALYTRSMLETLRADFARLPDLLAQAPPPQPDRAGSASSEDGLVVDDPPSANGGDREGASDPAEPANAKGGDAADAGAGDAPRSRPVAVPEPAAASERERDPQLDLF